jgi:hypothetical protein
MPNFHPYSVRYHLPLISLGRGDETDDLNRLVNGSLAAAARFKAIEENLRNPPGPSGGWQQFPLFRRGSAAKPGQTAALRCFLPKNECRAAVR